MIIIRSIINKFKTEILKMKKIKDVVNERAQPKITNFFKKADPNSSLTQSQSQSQPSRRRPINDLSKIPRPPPSTPKKKKTLEIGKVISRTVPDDDDILEVIEVEKPPPSPKPLVCLSSSDSEPEDGTPISGSDKSKHKLKETTGQTTAGTSTQRSGSANSSSSLLANINQNGFSEGDDSSSDAILSQMDIEEIIKSSQEEKENKSINLDRSGTFEEDNASSGDEVISQVDEEEVIRSSQHSSMSDSNSPAKESFSTPKDCPPTSPAPITPTKAALNNLSSLLDSLTSPKRTSKSPVTKFSPIRHLRMKRTSSEASLGSPSRNLQHDSRLTADSNNRSPNPSPKKKLTFDSNSQSKSAGMGGGRYYIRNFMGILAEVMGESFHSHLISKEDRLFVESFTCRSLDAQSLYVRLFQRKWNWKPLANLERYKEFSESVEDICRELVAHGFFEEISATNASIEEILDTLDLPKTLSLAKKMMVSLSKKTKDSCKEALLAKVRSQKTLTGSCGSGAVMKQALQELGPAYRVSQLTKTLFSRLFILHSPPQYWEIESDQASNQLLIVLLSNRGQMEYPTYKIRKETLVYRTREDLIKFHEAFTMHSNIVSWTELKDWERVIEVTRKACIVFEELLAQDDIVQHDSRLPRYLRIYTTGSVLAHVCWMGVDGFQKMKKFLEANELIRTILKQSSYLPNYRGRCWERLAINQGHLKKSKGDIKILLEEALNDPFLQPNHKLILSQRWEKIKVPKPTKKAKPKPMPKSRKKAAEAKQSKPEETVPDSGRRTRSGGRRKIYLDESDEEENNQKANVAEEMTQIIAPDEDVQVLTDVEQNQPEILTLKYEVPSRTITGEKMDRGPGNMGKAVFISRQDGTGSNRMSSVEQHAIDFYITSEGFTSGLHGEGSTVCTIYGLLFWDVIFHDDLPDAFHHRYQSFPLDLHFDDFYSRRKDLIDEKLNLIRNILSVTDLMGIVDQIRSENENKLSIVNWSIDPLDLKQLMRAMGTQMIADICERLARNYRYYSSGFPDLVVWSDPNFDGQHQGKVLFVEVKGPGDSLSPKQQLWLEWMMEHHIPCEVCHVKSVSNKRIRLER